MDISILFYNFANVIKKQIKIMKNIINFLMSLCAGIAGIIASVIGICNDDQYFILFGFVMIFYAEYRADKIILK